MRSLAVYAITGLSLSILTTLPGEDKPLGPQASDTLPAYTAIPFPSSAAASELPPSSVSISMEMPSSTVTPEVSSETIVNSQSPPPTTTAPNTIPEVSPATTTLLSPSNKTSQTATTATTKPTATTHTSPAQKPQQPPKPVAPTDSSLPPLPPGTPYSIVIQGHNELLPNPDEALVNPDTHTVIGHIGKFPIRVDNIQSIAVLPNTGIKLPEPEDTSRDWSGTERAIYIQGKDPKTGKDVAFTGYPSFSDPNVKTDKPELPAEAAIHYCIYEKGCAGTIIQRLANGDFTIQPGDSMTVIRPDGTIHYIACGATLSDKYVSDAEGNLVYDPTTGEPIAANQVLVGCDGKEPDFILVTCLPDGLHNTIISYKAVSAKPNAATH